ncbi:MAG: GNAT family N-acetyltransferase [Pseudomonadota bacterium]
MPLIRPHATGDLPAIAQIYFDAVHTGTAAPYDADQRRAWAGEAPRPDKWRARLQGMTVFVAEEAGVVTGFMSIDATDFLDLAFVAPRAAGRGVGGALYSHVEAVARDLGATRLHGEISLAARAFLERRGWRVIRRQSIRRAGVCLTNFQMEKPLVPPGARA